MLFYVCFNLCYVYPVLIHLVVVSVTDNCPTWFRGMVQMAVEMVSWLNYSVYVARSGSKLTTSGVADVCFYQPCYLVQLHIFFFRLVPLTFEQMKILIKNCFLSFFFFAFKLITNFIVFLFVLIEVRSSLPSPASMRRSRARDPPWHWVAQTPNWSSENESTSTCMTFQTIPWSITCCMLKLSTKLSG